MVHLGNWLTLSLSLAHGRTQGSSDASTALQRRDADGSPSYASNLVRLHRSVKRARSVMENPKTSISVPESEVASVLAKVQALEQQIEKLMQGLDFFSHGDGGHDEGGDDDEDQQACDAENLMFTLGARAVVDATGQVRDHAFFRRDANCTMESALEHESGSTKETMSGFDQTINFNGTVSAVESAATASPSGSDSDGDFDSDDDGDDESDASPESPSAPAPDSTSPPLQKEVVSGSTPDAAATPGPAIPVEPVVPVVDKQESTEVLGFSGAFVTTTVTRTRMFLSTVHTTGSATPTSTDYTTTVPAPPLSFAPSTGDKSKGVDGQDKQAAALGEAILRLKQHMGDVHVHSYKKLVDSSSSSSSSSSSNMTVVLNGTAPRPLSSSSLSGTNLNTTPPSSTPLNTTLPGNGTARAAPKRKFAGPKIQFRTVQVVPVQGTPATTYGMPASASASAPASPYGFQTVRRNYF
ncbi:hypothetical protein E4U42_005071 [Claviceps africana]|uniref:Uncharacterized protein n=1 Tax=Claviceps africana TaxID=83212 RepID=A0A8K0JAC4_9HYPO|nr:hypothetical protein E4U42_005071 [Claviceps africana]